MIQRIQSLYLLIVVILCSLLLSTFPLWQNDSAVAEFATDYSISLIGVSASGLLALLSIFLFKNRKLQFVLGRLNILINFFIIGFFVYWSLNLSGETNVSEKGIGMFVPLVSIVFLVLANKAIKKDEDLVKSVDRFR
ncbi:MAG: DUF4293 domain-containing protein [Flavobacteriaceae bacterium]|nr:DUF4293 domain-containing protein [Flavobacteriaceae bacterium]